MILFTGKISIHIQQKIPTDEIKNGADHFPLNILKKLLLS
jgi:hypothetical protein